MRLYITSSTKNNLLLEIKEAPDEGPLFSKIVFATGEGGAESQKRLDASLNYRSRALRSTTTAARATGFDYFLNITKDAINCFGNAAL